MTFQPRTAALCALALLSCAGGKARPRADARDPGPTAARADPLPAARALSAEAHDLLRVEGDLLWRRYTTGEGPLPASAAAEHPRLSSAPSLAQVAEARAAAAPEERRALSLLYGWMSSLAVARANAGPAEALERGRAGLLFAAPGEAHPGHGERDLDRLLSDEPSPPRRAAIAEAEAQAAAALAELSLARDVGETNALAQLGLPAFAQLIEQRWGAPPAELEQLAEQTLAATESVAARAFSVVAQQNLGLTSDRVRRADLPRMLRSSAADAAFPAERGWLLVQATLAGLQLDALVRDGAKSLAQSPDKSLPETGDKSLPRVRVDAEPLPAKGPRPLALLVDPPADVRLSLRPAGGHEEQRALLHEAARALGGALTQPTAAEGTAAPGLRWEEAQLGEGSAAEATAQLFEQLACDPPWLRANTGLRGEPLDELVHACAARRLLLARRAAALVLFELRRREGPQTREAHAALYRGLLQRATLALFSDADAGRWPLETDPALRAAATLQAALFAAQLELQLGKLAATSPQTPTPPASQTGTLPAGSTATQTATLTTGSTATQTGTPGQPAVWWRTRAAAVLLQKIWAAGRSLRAADAAQLQGAPLGAAALAQVVDQALSYTAPDPKPAAQRPDYKYMQGDRRAKKKKKAKKKH